MMFCENLLFRLRKWVSDILQAQQDLMERLEASVEKNLVLTDLRFQVWNQKGEATWECAAEFQKGDQGRG